MKGIGLYPQVRVDTSKTLAVGQAGGVILVETLRSSGLDLGLSAGLAPWRKPAAVHDPAKIICDLCVVVGCGRRLPRRRRSAAIRAWCVRSDRIRPDRLPHHHRAGR